MMNTRVPHARGSRRRESARFSTQEASAHSRRRLRFWPVVLLLALPFAGQLRAQTNAVKSAPSSNRYLLIVDTARSMKPRTEGLQATVRDLLESGMRGQMRRGDTLGVWTFNESLHAGLFPLQQWTPEAQKGIVTAVLGFLREQKYEKQTSLDKVLPVMDRVIKASAGITVILISDGEEEFRGTPFDDPINDFHRLWRNQQQKARMPFVTVLCARGGQITDYTVNSAPWPVEIPPLPPEVKVAPVVAKAPAPEKPHAPPVPPLIISGKKPQEIVGPARTESSTAKVDAPPAGSANNGAGPPTNIQQIGAPVSATETAKLEPAAAVQSKPAVESTPAQPDPAVTGPASAREEAAVASAQTRPPNYVAAAPKDFGAAVEPGVPPGGVNVRDASVPGIPVP